MKILIAEDEKKVRHFLKKGLDVKEFSVDTAANLDEVFSAMLTIKYDIIILDRLLNGIDSLPYISELKKKSPLTQILVLSALSEVTDKVDGLTEGADDYLAKPFHITELIARLRALGRRSDKNKGPSNEMHLQNLHVSLDTQRVERGEKRIHLTAKEYKLLVFLMRKPNKIFSKTELIDSIWELQYYPESNVVEVAMNHLRAKIDKGFQTALIHSRRGTGYWIGDADL